jgi:hypothetical protein
MSQDTTQKLASETIELFKGITSLENAKLHFEVLMLSKNISGKKRGWIERNLSGPTGTILKKIYKQCPEHKDMIREDIANPDVFLQFENMKTYFMALPKAKRDQVESYVEGIYNIYKLN